MSKIRILRFDNPKKYIYLAETNNKTMTIYLHDQAKSLLESDSIPVNSIGVCRTRYGWAYWFYDGLIFDSGVKSTEGQALRTAKMNIR